MSTIVVSPRISGCKKLYLSDGSTWDAGVTGVTVQIYMPGSVSPDIEASGLSTGFVDQLYEAADLGLDTTATLPDGVWQFAYIEEGDDAESGTFYYLNLCNLDAAINAKIETMLSKTCECENELCQALCKWKLLREGIITRFKTSNLTNINADVASLYELVSGDFDCGC